MLGGWGLHGLSDTELGPRNGAGKIEIKFFRSRFPQFTLREWPPRAVRKHGETAGGVRVPAASVAAAERNGGWGREGVSFRIHMPHTAHRRPAG